MADKEFSIELTTANSERNAGRLLADLDSITKEIRGVTEAAASMDLKSKRLTGTLSRLVGEGKKVTLAFKDTAEGLKLVGVNATDTSRKLAELAKQQNIIDKQAAGSAKLNFLVQKGKEIQLLKEKIDLQAKEARFTRANAALEVGVKGGEKLTRLREEQALGNKLLRIDEARRRSQEKLIDAPARNVRAHNKALKEQAVALAKTERASAKAKLAQERLTQSNNRAKNSTTNLSISWSSLVRLLSAQVIYRAVFGLAGQLRQAFENAIELQVAIAELQTIAPPSESFSDFSEILRKVSDAFGLDIIEATEAGYQALSNQVVDTAAEMEAFLTVMGKLAIATRSTLAEATNLTTGVLNAYRLEVGKANEVSAKLFKTIELGRVRAEEMANSLGNVAILANQVGLSMDELLGLIATLTVQGIRFSEAQTQIRGILIKLIKPTRDMTEFLTDLGFASGEAAIKSLGLIKFLALMSERTGDSTTEIAKLINRVRGLSGALAVTGKGFDLLQRNIDEISKKSMPAFNRAINIVLDNQGKKFLIFQNQLKNFFTQDIGQEFVSTLSILVGGFENLIKVIKVTVEIIVTALVPAISAAVFTLGKAFFTLSVPLSGFKIAMISLFVVGTAFVGVLRTLKTHTTQLADSINDLRKAARNVAEEIQQTLVKALDEVTNKVLDLVEAINSTITSFAAGTLTRLSESIRDIVDLFDSIGDSLSDSIDAAGDKIKEVLDKFESGLSRAQTLVKKIADEFKRINLSVAQQVFEITFDAATPAEQAQLLTDKLVDLQAILGSGVDVDVFRKTQKEIEKIIIRQQKTTQEALDVEKKSAIETVKARAKAVADIIKLLEKRDKELRKSKFRGGRQVSGPNLREVAAINQKIIELRRSLADFTSQLLQARIGAEKLGDFTVEGVDTAADAARKTLAEATKTSLIDAAAAAINLLTPLEAVAKTLEIVTREGVELGKIHKLELERLTDFFDNIDIEDIFKLKNINDFEQAITDIIAKLESLAKVQRDLTIDDSATQLKISDITKAAFTEREELELKIATKQLKFDKDRLAATTDLLKADIAANVERLTSLQGLIDATNVLTETRAILAAGEPGSFFEPSSETVILNQAMADLVVGVDGATDKIEAVKRAIEALTNLPTEDNRIKLISALKNLSDVIKIPPLSGRDAEQNFNAQNEAFTLITKLLRTLTNIQAQADPAIEGIPKGLAELQNAIEQGNIEFAKGFEALEAIENKLLERGIGNNEILKSTAIIFKDAITKFAASIDRLAKLIPARTSLASGGIVGGIGSSDSIPAMLTPGEFVVNKKSTSKFFSQLVGINRNSQTPQKLAEGGLVEVGGISINITDSGSPRQTAKAVADELNRGIRQGTIQLRR